MKCAQCGRLLTLKGTGCACDECAPASSGTVEGVVGPRHCALCGEWPARETKNGLRCHLCECRDICAEHPVPMPGEHWKREAVRLREALQIIARNVDAGAVGVAWCGEYAKSILALPVAGNPVTANTPDQRHGATGG